MKCDRCGTAALSEQPHSVKRCVGEFRRTIATLERELKEMRELMANLYGTTPEDRALLQQENVRLREALKRYGGHTGNCAYRLTADIPCDCGLREALSADPTQQQDERNAVADEPQNGKQLPVYGGNPAHTYREDEYMCRGGGIHRNKSASTVCLLNPCLITQYQGLAADRENP